MLLERLCAVASTLPVECPRGVRGRRKPRRVRAGVRDSALAGVPASVHARRPVLGTSAPSPPSAPDSKVADGDYFAVVAADLQEPPELLLVVRRALETGDVDLVLGERREPRRSVVTRSTAGRVLVVATDGSSSRRCHAAGSTCSRSTTRCGRRSWSCARANSSLVGQLLWIGFRRTTVPYDRRARRPERVRGRGTEEAALHVRQHLLRSPTCRFGSSWSSASSVGRSSVSVVAASSWLPGLTGLIESPGYTPLMLAILVVGVRPHIRSRRRRLVRVARVREHEEPTAHDQASVAPGESYPPGAQGVET